MSWRLLRGAFALGAVTLSLVCAATTPAQPPDRPPAQPPVTKTEDVFDGRAGATVMKGQLLVTLQPGVPEGELKAIFARFGAQYEVVGRVESLNQFTLHTDHERLPELRLRLANHPYVASATFNAINTISRQPVTKPDVNDPVFAKPDDKLVDADNWNLYRIKVPEAWQITKGGATIAVVDSGAKLDHEELIGRTLDPRTFAPDAAAREGVKKLREKGGTVDGEVRDHGTHVSITAAGAANNGVGTAGVAPDSPVLPIQALYYRPGRENDGTGVIRGDDDQLIAGIEHAVSRGAAVVNCSFGNEYSDEVLKRWREASPEGKQQIEQELMPRIEEQMRAYARVLDLANRRGTIVVVSAGNQNMPAHLYALPLSQRAIVVAATDDKDQRCGFSNFGPYTNVSAPGQQIFSGLARETKDRGFYARLNGTSMAAPHVTGVVALMKTIDPGLKHADVVDILMSTGTRLNTNEYIGPLVNARAALDETKRRRAAGEPRLPEPPPLSPEPPPVVPAPPVPGAPPPAEPVLPELPPNPITLIEQPDPWNSVYVQQIIRVWLSMAIAPQPVGGAQGGFWVYNQYGQIVNVRISVTVQRPVWFGFQFRWLWENSMVLRSTNMGSLYEFVVGTLRQGRFNAAPPRTPEPFRPRATDPRPRQAEGVPFDPRMNNTKWAGKNAKNETVELVFGTNVVAVTRAGKTARYRVSVNTYVDPMTVDLYPEDGGDVILGLLRATGFGEILFRTDFTKARPKAINRGDPLAFVLKRADVAVTDPGATADGTQLPVLYRGTETLIRSLDYPKPLDPKTAWGTFKHHRVHSYALSGDGKRLWLVLFNPEEKDLARRVQLWSMSATGGDAKQSAFEWPENPDGTVEKVATNHDGSTAWLHIRHKRPFSNDNRAFFQTATPGGKARVVLDTNKLKDVTHATEWRLSADGRTIVLVTNEGLMRVGADGKHHTVVTLKHIEHGGKSVADGGTIGNLVTSADGTHWAVTARVGPYSLQGKTPTAVVVGSPQGHKLIVEPNKDGTFQEYRRLSMSADGRTLLVEKAGVTRVFRNGHVAGAWAAHAGVYNGIVSGDGNTMYASWRPPGSNGDYPPSTFLEDLQTGRRHRVMTGALATRWDTWWTQSDNGYIQLSAGGRVVLSAPEGAAGAYLFHGGAEPTAHHPTIKSVRQRYEGEYLVITVEATAPDKVGKIWLAPIKDGALLPSWAVRRELNALAWMDHRRPLAPVDKRPDVYEARIWIGNLGTYLDASYTFRVTVANAEETRATFRDYPVLR